MRRLLAILLVACVLVMLPASAFAARVALVIGNAAYEKEGEALLNPVHDADAFAAFLRSIGFSVVEVTNASRAEMGIAVSDFANSLKADDTALFYYSGHGMQMDGENYLVAVDARLESALNVPAEALPLTGVLDLLQQRARVAMVFVDACRNNPLADSLARNAGRGITRGLAPISQQGDGLMVAFAAAPGQEALDGLGDHSPFTTALIAHLGEPGLEVGTAFKRVIRDVRDATLDRQLPQLVSSLSAEVYLGGATPPHAPAPVAPGPVPVVMPAPDTASANTPPSPTTRPVVIRPAVVPAQPEPLATTPPQATEPAQVAVATPAPATNELPPLHLPAAQCSSLDPATCEEEPPEAAAPPPVTPTLSPAELALAVQTELNRVGCDAGSPDGVWGRKSRAAVALYAENASRKLAAVEEPTQALLDSLKSENGRVCPLTCGVTEKLEGGQCVAKTCPAGQQLSSKGVCYTPQKQASTPAKPKSGSGKSSCFTFNDQTFCE